MTDDKYDLNRDSKVTEDEIDQTVGKRPSVPWWTTMLSAVPVVGPAVAPAVGIDRQGNRDNWDAKKDALYKKYKVGPYLPQRAPLGTQAQALPTGAAAPPGTKLPDAGGIGLKVQSGGGGNAVAEKSYKNYERIYGTAPFGTLGVNQNLIDLGLVREELSPTGDIVYVTPRRGGESVEMQYKAQDAYITLAEMDQQQLANFRKAMYVSGYGTAASWVGPVTVTDIESLVNVMTDANFSGGTWDEVVNQRVDQGGRFARPLTVYEGAMAAGDTAAVLKEYAKRNGIVLSDSLIAGQTRAVAEGDITIEDLLTLLKETYVKTLYPAYAAEVDAGLTIEDVAGPWRSMLAETFGVSEDRISLFDPLMQEALTRNPADGVSKTSMREFSNLIAEDPRWEYSPDAWNTIGLASDNLARDFGFNTDYTQLGA